MNALLLCALLRASSPNPAGSEPADPPSTLQATERLEARPACGGPALAGNRSELDAAALVDRALRDPRLQLDGSGPSTLEPILRAVSSWLRRLLSLSEASGAARGIRIGFLLLMAALLGALLVHSLRQARRTRRADPAATPDPAEIASLRLSLDDARQQLAARHPRQAMRTGIQVLGEVLVGSQQLPTARTLTPLELRDSAPVRALDGRTEGAAGRALQTYQQAVLAGRPLAEDQVEGFLQALETSVDALQGRGEP